jgi:hypothetical protein
MVQLRQRRLRAMRLHVHLMTQALWRSDLVNKCAGSSVQLSDLKSHETPDDPDGLSFLRIALIYSCTWGMNSRGV